MAHDKLYFEAKIRIIVHTGEDAERVEEQLAERIGELGDIEAGFVVVDDQQIKLVDAK